MEQPALAARKILSAQTIDVHGPGTVLRDFETLLQFVSAHRVVVSSKNNLLPMLSLAQLNEQMAHPIALALKRPQQRSYPHIHALYLLMRTTSPSNPGGNLIRPSDI